MESGAPQKEPSVDLGGRVPASAFGFHANFCKNPVCPNFGVLAQESLPKGEKDRYCRDRGTPWGHRNAQG